MVSWSLWVDGKIIQAIVLGISKTVLASFRSSQLIRVKLYYVLCKGKASNGWLKEMINIKMSLFFNLWLQEAGWGGGGTEMSERVQMYNLQL